MFYAYAVLGLVCVALYKRLPHTRITEPSHHAPLGPSRGIVYRLAALFSLDAFAGGFVVQSLMALWLFQRFDLSVSAASLFFFWAGILSAFSYPVAARLAPRFGLVNTMVFTHIPSSIFLILAAFSSNLYVTLGLLLLRSALSQMEVPTRTSYVMAVVTPAERATAASVTAVPRSLASAISPYIRRGPIDGCASGPIAGCVRRSQDFLRFRAAVFVPPSQTAGRNDPRLCPGVTSSPLFDRVRLRGFRKNHFRLAGPRSRPPLPALEPSRPPKSLSHNGFCRRR